MNWRTVLENLLLGMALAIACVAFIEWDVDPSHWKAGSRAATAFIGGGLVLLIAVLRSEP